MFCSKQVMIGTSKNIFGFDPRSVPGCQLWLDAADSLSLVLSGSSVTSWNDKSGNGYHMNILTAKADWSGNAEYPTIGTSINGLQTINFTPQAGLRQSTTLDGVKNLFWVGRIAAPTGSGGIHNSYFFLGHEAHIDWHGLPYGQKFLDPAIATAGILNASPTSLFTSDANAITNTAFSNVFKPSAPNVSLLSVSGITGSTRYQGLCFDRVYHFGWCGDLAEVLIYSTALTTSQRQQVEGYLAHKWGIQTSLPITQSYYSLRPHLRVFQPIDVPGCQLWLDGADQSSITLSGSNVTQWRDKSLNVSSTTSVAGSNVLTQNAMNGRPAILLNGSSSFTGSTTGSGTTLTICIVATQASECAGNGGLFCFGRTGFPDWNDVGSLAITKYSTNSGQMICTRVTNSQTVNTGVSTPFMYVLVFDGTFVNSYLNGTIQTPSNISRTGTFAYTEYKIGTRAGNHGDLFWTGFIGESIVYNTALTTTQRQQVEGYLAHKWGLTPSLPVISPLSIPGCQLWLDAADSSTITGTTSVTQWRDKSGNARHLGVGSGTTSYSSNAIVLNSSYMFVTSPVDLSKVTVFIVVKTTGGNNQTVFSGRPNSNYEWDSLDGFGFFMDGQNSIRFYGQYANVSTFSVNTSTPQVFSFQSSGTSLTAWYNGVSQTGATLSSARTSTAQGFMVGASWSGSSYNNIIANASLYEIIVYNSDVNTTQRQQIEGYLAHKWGLLTSTIPSTHPFSKFPPSSVTPNKPLAIETITLTSLTTSSGVINWTTTNATGYTWYVGTGSGSGQVATGTITNGSTLTATVTYAFVIGTTYYAWVIPYNLDGLGPTTISAPVTFSAGFSPTSISGCQLWLDGNDPAGTGTQPANGATVSTWVDKSGNGRNATVAPSRVVGIYSTSFKAVNFATSSTGYITSYSAAPTNETMFVVFNNPSPSSPNNIIIGGVQGARSLGAGYTASGTGTVGNLNTQVAWLARTGSYTAGTTMIVTSKFTTSTNTISLNGGVNTASGGAPGFTAGRVTYLGVDATNSFFHYVGYGMEILFYNSVLTTLQTQQVEGYLAWKWGLTGSLPAGHPYKTVQP